jgi:Lipopolysaccharide-assembly
MDLFKTGTVFLVMLTVASFIGTGCGYHFSANGKPVGIEINSIAIPLVTSSSSEKGFEADFTRIIREEFISHSEVSIVETEQADMVLTGRISEIKTQPLSYDSRQYDAGGRVVTHETTNSRRLKIRLDISLVERANGKIIWHDGDIEEGAQFNVETDPLATQYNQQQALIKISRLLAKRIYLKTMERF